MRAREHAFVVTAMSEVARDIFRARIATDAAEEICPGQFVNLAVPGDGAHVLRIPLSYASVDATTSTIELVFAVVGEGTRRLSSMRPGDTSVLTGPLGHGWELPREEGRALLVAGGIGLPPVVAAARMLAGHGIALDIVVGARSASYHVDYLIDELEAMGQTRVILTTDDGSRGIHGYTTAAMENLLAENHYASVYACGPEPMLKGVAALAERTEVACQVSLERMMGCGFGACSCCNVALRAGGYALCCTDGPVFDAREVAW